MCDPNKLKIMYWNADGLRLKIEELSDLLLERSIDIVAVSETRLSPTAFIEIPGYVIYREDKHTSGKGQGVALVVRNDIIHNTIIIPLTSVLEAVGIQVTVSGSTVVIISAYQSPNLPLNTDDIGLLLKLGRKVLILGDFNANHALWHCPFTNPRGKQLADYMLSSEFTIHYPDTPTLIHYIDSYRPTTPDLCLAKNISQLSSLSTLPALSSNHLPVAFDLLGKVESSSVVRWDYSKANWTKFREYLNARTILTASMSISTAEIDASVLDLTKTIIEARDKFVPQKKQQLPKKLPRFIKKRIKDKNFLQKCLQQEKDPATRRILRASVHELQTKIQIAIKNNNDVIWNNKMRSVDNPSSDIWKIIKSTCTDRSKSTAIPPLRKPDGNLTTSPSEICNTLADGFHSNMLLTSDWTSPAVEKQVKSSLDVLNSDIQNSNERPEIIHPNEIWRLLRKLKCRKSPGVDNVHNSILKNLPHKSVVLLTKIFNDCFRLKYFPAFWKVAKVIAIKKPGKDMSVPSSYRPISLLPTLSKVFERLILLKLSRVTDKVLIKTTI